VSYSKKGHGGGIHAGVCGAGSFKFKRSCDGLKNRIFCTHDEYSLETFEPALGLGELFRQVVEEGLQLPLARRVVACRQPRRRLRVLWLLVFKSRGCNRRADCAGRGKDVLAVKDPFNLETKLAELRLVFATTKIEQLREAPHLPLGGG
jgi:hypothetical protein